MRDNHCHCVAIILTSRLGWCCCSFFIIRFLEHFAYGVFRVFMSLKWFINGNSSRVRERLECFTVFSLQWLCCICIFSVYRMMMVAAVCVCVRACVFNLYFANIYTLWVLYICFFRFGFSHSICLAICVGFYCLVTVNVKMPFRKFDILYSVEPSTGINYVLWIKMTANTQSLCPCPSHLCRYCTCILFFFAYSKANRTLNMPLAPIKRSNFCNP